MKLYIYNVYTHTLIYIYICVYVYMYICIYVYTRMYVCIFRASIKTNFPNAFRWWPFFQWNLSSCAFYRFM